MRIIINKTYYKNSVKGREPIKYSVKQPKGVGTDVHASIKIDPVLKKHKDLRKALLYHEKREISAWGSGKTNAHSLARKREPKLTKNIGGVSGFWKEIGRREKLNGK